MKPYIHTVQYYETDCMGITHHSNYIRWMEEARVDFLTQVGWPLKTLEEMGVVSPVTALESRFHATTTFADAVSIRVAVLQCSGVRMKLAYTMAKKQGVPIAFAAWGRKNCPAICEEMRRICDFSFDTPQEFGKFLFG